MGKLSKVLKAIDDAKARKITAYHGTPHDVDKFSMEKIGTGEGAQAYGHGLYFAESPDVAKMYREALAGDEYQHFVNGRLISEQELRDMDWADNYAINALGRPDAYQPETLVERMREQGVDENSLNQLQKALDRYSGKVDFKRDVKGNLYKVELDIDPDTEMLDWDLPLSKQPESVQKAIDDHLTLQGVESYISPVDNVKVYVNRGITSDTKGSELLSIFGSKEKATKQLAPYGVKGIKYDDGFSRGKEGGTKNFVVFDDSLISIAEKNGIPMQQVDELAEAQGIPKQQALAMLIGGTGGVALMGGTERAEAAGMPAVNTDTKNITETVDEDVRRANKSALHSFIERRKKRGNSLINRAQYYGEPAATVATAITGGLFGDAAGGLAGLVSAPFVGRERAAEIVQSVQDYIPYYEPQSEAGIQGMEAFGGVVDKGGQLYRDAVDYYGIDPMANFNQTAEDLHRRGYDLPAAVLKGLPNIL